MKVYVTGLGICSALGDSVDDVWLRLLSGETAVRHWPDLQQQGFRVSNAARINEVYHDRRGMEIGISAALSAIKHANIDTRNVGVYVGSTMGESAAFEYAAESGKQVDVNSCYPCALPELIQRELGLEGPRLAFGAACASGNYAIGAAAELMRQGNVDCMLAGGVEPFSRIAMTGFSRSRAMAGDICRPFDEKRNGMSLGEGAAFLLLESEASVEARKALPLAEIGALGLSCDAYHPMAPNPSGEGIERAIKTALLKSDLEIKDVDWICAHGSGTKASDAAEARAIKALFGSELPVSGYKGAFGHTLGAATAIEAVICANALNEKRIPRTSQLLNMDKTLEISVVDENLHSGGMKWALNCGYAFGGVNSALVMGAVS